MVVFGQNGFNWEKRLYAGKLVVFGRSGSVRAKWWYWCKSCFVRIIIDVLVQLVVIGQKKLYTDELVVFGQSCCIPAKVVVFGQSGCNRAKWL